MHLTATTTPHLSTSPPPHLPKTAFDESTETSERTGGKTWLDDIDVQDDGTPSGSARTLAQQLEDRGFGPAESELSFCGVVTNRCAPQPSPSHLHSNPNPNSNSNPEVRTVAMTMAATITIA